MYVFAIYHLCEIDGAHAVANLIEFVAALFNLLPPLTSIVLPQTYSHYVETRPVMEAEY